MEFVNHTPFPAIAFEGVTPDETTFHVAVLRQTFTFANGALAFADEQTPLCECDEFEGAFNETSLLAESDLCPFKPACDILVNATAHAPGGQAVQAFSVRLRVQGPDRPMPQPPRPQGLNPLMDPSESGIFRYEDLVARAARETLPGQTLMDKELRITGPRQFRKKRLPLRILQGLFRVLTLGLLRPNPWKLTRPGKFISLPIRYEHAFGGQHKVLISDPAAKRLPKKCWLPGATPEELRADFLASGEPGALAHTHFEGNPLGKGFAQPWFLKATRTKSLPAPQIETPRAPITARHFFRDLRGKAKPKDSEAFQPQGFGILSKAWRPRLHLLGTVDSAFAQSERSLPEAFDFAYWNGAPLDQQIPYLKGDEVITLTNLCSPETPGARFDSHGNTELRLELPGHQPFLLVRQEEGELTPTALELDTLNLDLEKATLVLVWRGTLPKEPGIRAVEARMMTREERLEVEELRTWLNKEPEPDWKTAMMAQLGGAHG